MLDSITPPAVEAVLVTMGLSITYTLLLYLLLWCIPARTQWLDYETVPASTELAQELERFWSYGRSPPVYPARTSHSAS